VGGGHFQKGDWEPSEEVGAKAWLGGSKVVFESP